MSCDSPVTARVGPEPEAPAAAPTVPDRGTAVSGGGGGTPCTDVSGWTETDCLAVTVVADSGTGRCGAVDEDQTIYLSWDPVDSRWEGSFDFAYVGSTGPFHFWLDQGTPKASIDGEYGVRVGCDPSGGYRFGFGGVTLCPETEGFAAVECANKFVVRIACAPCVPSWWVDEGWYCMLDVGTATCVPTYLESGDETDPDLSYCSGPHADEAAAIAACGETTTECDVSDWPTSVCITISPGSDACPEVEATSFVGVLDEANSSPTQVAWRVDHADLWWSISGYVFTPCDPASWATGACTSPGGVPSFVGSYICYAIGEVVADCAAHSNQEVITATHTSMTDFLAEIDLTAEAGGIVIRVAPLSGYCGGPILTACCPFTGLPISLDAQFTHKTGGFSALPDTVPLVNYAGEAWEIPVADTVAACDLGTDLTIACVDGDWTATSTALGFATVATFVRCDPLCLVFDVEGTCGETAGTMRIVVGTCDGVEPCYAGVAGACGIDSQTGPAAYIETTGLCCEPSYRVSGVATATALSTEGPELRMYTEDPEAVTFDWYQTAGEWRLFYGAGTGMVTDSGVACPTDEPVTMTLSRTGDVFTGTATWGLNTVVLSATFALDTTLTGSLAGGWSTGDAGTWVDYCVEYFTPEAPPCCETVSGYQLIVSGVSAGTCDGCPSLNGTFLLNGGPPEYGATTYGAVDCTGFGYLAWQWRLFSWGGGVWTAYIGNYGDGTSPTWSASGYECDYPETITLTLTDPGDGGCDVPSTLTFTAVDCA